jgi:Ca2+-binding EF-hand superfamily protein
MTKYLIIAAAAGAALAGQAAAQDVSARPPARDLTRDAAMQRAQGAFQRLDLNGDGTLTHDEARQAAAQFMARRSGIPDPRISARIERMFAGVQAITLQQYQQEALARFDRQDVNHDGVVTVSERRQSRENLNSQ